jgi:PAS domain S-box-containing protein
MRGAKKITEQSITNARDITERKRLEAKLTQYREQLNELMEQHTTELKTVNKHLETLLAEHKNTEKSLVISEDKYHLLVENANEAITVAQEGMLKFANLKATELSGYSREELISMPFAKLVHPDDREMVTERHLKRLQGKGLLLNYPFRIIDKNGLIRWVEISVVFITWEGGPATLSLLTDITERKQAEDKLRESVRDHRDLAKSISDIFFAFDKDLRYTYWNKASEELTGVSAKDALGKHLRDVFPDTEMTRKAEKAYRKVLKTKRPQYFSMEYQVGDKHYFFEMSAYPSKKGLSVFAKDITGKKQTEEKLLLGTEKLLRAMQSTIQAISMTVEIRDPYTAGHQHRTTKLACAIGKHVGLSEDRIEGLNLAGIVHDIGKIYIPAEILSKSGKLNEIEFAMIKMHPQAGYDILKGIEFPWPIAQIVLQHHERMDGSGYPNGLHGEDIILEARILAVADVIEAMASHRPYRPALGIDKALDEIMQNKGILYDADIVDACVELFTEKGFKFE